MGLTTLPGVLQKARFSQSAHCVLDLLVLLLLVVVHNPLMPWERFVIQVQRT